MRDFAKPLRSGSITRSRRSKAALGSAYRVNGLIVPAEMQVALDDKHAIEVLKSPGDLHGGSVAAGGVINFITKRAADVLTVRIGTGDRGGTY